MSNLRFLITGATGATGGAAAAQLLEKGRQVRAFVHREDDRSEHLRKRGAEIVIGDLMDFDAVREALKGVNRAYFVYPIRPGLVQATAQFAQSALGEDLKRERDTLAAADAQRDDAALETVAAHRVDQSRRQHGARRPDRMAMSDGATLDIDDVLRQTELARHNDGDRRKGLIDLDPLDVAEFPPGAVEGPAHRRDRSEAEHPRLDGGNAVGDEAGCRFDTAGLRPIPIR
jgi:hypothetical protein